MGFFLMGFFSMGFFLMGFFGSLSISFNFFYFFVGFSMKSSW